MPVSADHLWKIIKHNKMLQMQSPITKDNRRKGKNKSACKTNNMELIEGSLVLCTVKKIEKTTVFLEIEGNGEGSMVLSEVAAGRIRNLRDHVAPNRRIVCKILRIENGNIQLSLRRVTGKEKELVLQQYERERNITNMLKAIIKSPEILIDKIKKEYNLIDFFEEAKENPSLLKKFFVKEELEKLSKILIEKLEKEKIVRKIFRLSSNSKNGLSVIKEVLLSIPAKIKYLGSSKFSIEIQAKDFKEANKQLLSALDQIQSKAKQKKALFEIIEK